MVERIAVVGVGGVGMAHVIAATRTGGEVTDIVDTNPPTLRRARDQWRNVWGDVVEEAEPQAGTRYWRSIQELQLAGRGDVASLVILAVPPAFHEDVTEAALKAWPKSHIIAEKPLMFIHGSRFAPQSHRLSMSAEWVHHSQAMRARSARSIGMCFPEPQGDKRRRSWRLPLALEFMPHLLSLTAPFKDIVDMQVTHATQKAFRIEVETSAGAVTMWGDRISEPGIYFDEHRYPWENDLFDKQIAARGGAEITKMMQAEDILWRALYAHVVSSSAQVTGS